MDSYARQVAEWCATHVRERGSRPLVIGINGPQGCGKSQLAARVVCTLHAQGLRGVAISIDDFYWTYEEQRALGRRFANHRLLTYRGYPGTHDVALGQATLHSLIRMQPTCIPVYDKSAHAGLGDRAPAHTFRRVDTPVDFLILEGWMLGFRAVDALGLDRLLHAPNSMLAPYAAWDALIHCFIRLDPPSLHAIVAWRMDAERARRERGEGALSDAQARDYIERFIPAYQTYLPGLREHTPGNGRLEIALGPDRSAVTIVERA